MRPEVARMSGVQLQTAYVGNSILVDMRGLKDDSVQSAGVLSSTVTSCVVTIVTSGVTDLVNSGVVGGSWPVAMTQVDTVTGRWQAVVTASLALVDAERYQAVIDVRNSDLGRRIALWRVPLVARQRERT